MNRTLLVLFFLLIGLTIVLLGNFRSDGYALFL